MNGSLASGGPSLEDLKDDDDDSGENTFHDDNSDEDLNEIRPASYALGLNRRYVGRWTEKEGFREFYQNWKDAIVGSFDLDPRRDFHPKWSSTPNEIRITVHRDIAHPDGHIRQELLGFIRWNRRAGSVEMSNFKARLSMENLSLGGTSKHLDKFAGTHGEGFKLAALVMRRKGLGVRISASSFYWNFSFRGIDKDRFYCQISRPSDSTLLRANFQLAQQQSRGPRQELTSYISRDVTVRLSKARDSTGRTVTESEFRKWTEVALELQNPSPDDIIRTEVGDLILDPQFSGRVYLKGLRLSSHAPDGRQYVFGYNFATGHVNRDREWMSEPKEVAELLAKMWEKPILEDRQDVMRRYVGLFRGASNVPDIAFADSVISEATARKLWALLRADKQGTFFYCESGETTVNAVDRATLIVSTLKRRPEAISKVLWKVFRRYSLIRTISEEKVHLFILSQKAKVPDTHFGINVHRMLESALQLDERLKDIQIEVVSGGGTGLELLFEATERRILIHEKWLDFAQAHEHAGCELDLLARNGSATETHFSCDHIVEDLFELVINDVQGPLQLAHSEASAIRKMARERIPQMPRGVSVHKTNESGVLEVKWKGNEGGVIAEKYGERIMYCVTLHKMSSCTERKSDLLQLVDPDGISPSSCDCPQQTVCRQDSVAIFRGLDCSEAYFPMVARKGNKTLFGMPPSPATPAKPATSSKRPRQSGPRRSRQSQVATGTQSRPSSVVSPVPTSHVHEPLGQDTNALNIDDDSPLPLISSPLSTLAPTPSLSPSHLCLKRPKSICGDEWRAWNQDEANWHSWEQDVFPNIIARLFSPAASRDTCEFFDRFSNFSLHCERLECTFEREMYAAIHDNRTSSRYIIMIHDVHIGDDECHVDGPHLVVTRYSFVEDEPFLSGQKRESLWTEVVLQHSGTGSMGSRQAGEILNLDDIAKVEVLSEDSEVILCLQPPIDVPSNSSSMFCRLARWAESTTVIFMPLARELLPRSDRRKLEGFMPTGPISVIDFTPNVLGPSVGFVDQGCQISSGIEFDEHRHQTWRVLNPGCKVFDGSLEVILDDFPCSDAMPPDLGPSGCPKIAIIAGENHNFRLSLENTEMPQRDAFLRPLKLLDLASSSRFKPDFLVLLMPATVLHESAAKRLSETIGTLIDQGRVVHISLQSLREYSIPQNRHSLAITSSLYPALAEARIGPLSCDTVSAESEFAPKSVAAIIGELEFTNPRQNRQGHESSRGFVCSSAFENVYNHYTGQSPTQDIREIKKVDMDAESVPHLSVSSELVHPTRNDLLTVRELARLQGLDDKILFYGSHEAQRGDVLAAHPPALTRSIAVAIQSVIKASLKKQFGDADLRLRANKRRRADDENGPSTEPKA